MGSDRQRVKVPVRPGCHRDHGLTALVLLAAIVAYALLALLAPAAQAARPAAASGAPGTTMVVEVDASNVAQWIFVVRQTLPVSPGKLRLLYPRWPPGYHGPYGDTAQVGGLVVTAQGRPLPWRRAVDDLNGFDLEVPSGTPSLDIRFQWLGDPKAEGYPPPISKHLLGLQWHALLLYPAGHRAADIAVQAAVRLPAGWHWGSALRAASQAEGWVRFETVSLDTLVDSPLYAGAHYRRIELDPAGAARPVAIHLFEDGGTSRRASEAQIDAHRRLVQQGDRLFGSRPWRHYDLLLANVKGLSGTALEHHESSENAYDGRYFDDWATASRRREDVAHEFVHAWNGKYRRPADLWAPDFNTTAHNSLLWIYEGLTEYWGMVVAARSGLISDEQVRGLLAGDAAWVATSPGRQWRNLQDTTHDPALRSTGKGRWPAWSRGWDYYTESALLIWLDADTLIREASQGQRSLDDLARSFFRGAPGDKGPDLYTLDEFIAALNVVQPHDWHAFVRERLDRHGTEVALDGLTRAGWRLAFNDQRSALQLASLDPQNPVLHLTHSIGLGIAKDGLIKSVQWGSAAFADGLVPGDRLIAVNLKAYEPERLEAALVANKDGGQPLDLLVQRDDDFLQRRLDVRGGPRYPALVRAAGTPDRLADILQPR